MLWAAQWRSRNLLDGGCRHLLHENCTPTLFQTRAAARAWIEDRYGYIRKRPDLRQEPHGWRMPQPVKVRVEVLS